MPPSMSSYSPTQTTERPTKPSIERNITVETSKAHTPASCRGWAELAVVLCAGSWIKLPDPACYHGWPESHSRSEIDSHHSSRSHTGHNHPPKSPSKRSILLNAIFQAVLIINSMVQLCLHAPQGDRTASRRSKRKASNNK